MARTKDAPSVTSYYKALQQIVSLQSRVLTGALPHNAERGRNDEERVREFLHRVLPRRFSIGSGFIVCSQPGVPPSKQTDIVLYDDLSNSPLQREATAYVYPIEIVYATIEVKATLTRAKLLDSCRAIAKIRALGQHQHYVDYVGVPKDPQHPEQLVSRAFVTQEITPPRAFVFAHGVKGFPSVDTLIDGLRGAVNATGVHIHGLVVLDKDWYVTQEAYASGQVFHPHVGDALMRFVRGMLNSIGSRRIRPAWMNPYLEPEPPRSTQPTEPAAATPKPRAAPRSRV